jgi:hypothetical protein
LWGQGLVKATVDWTYLYHRGYSSMDFKVVGPSYNFKTIKVIVGQEFGTVWAPTRAPNYCQLFVYWLWDQGLVKATIDWTYLYSKGYS